MIVFCIYSLLILQVILLLCLWRGPTYSDRMVVLNAISSKANVMILLVGVLYDRVSMFSDITLSLSLLTLIGTLAFTEFLKSENRV